ncbi:PaaI family thioesterase [Sphingomonas olei]|uniref:PaaI family thioesterase n=1 Tax=Sphingomonas olei TaxID=1886787 RepID=A0ABY2QF60_9SPHN|nr:PaaI family thioesterase [Sphingomonas olei]THG38700.1 PaaI family thioesterase [Sphingomonas olei]
MSADGVGRGRTDGGPILSVEELRTLLAGAFPGRAGEGGTVEVLGPGTARMILDPLLAMARPGNIVSGPTLMTLADHVAYAVILAHTGPMLMAVTHTLTMSFLRACRFERIVADATILKMGRRLVTVDVRIWQGSEAGIVAQATVGYTLPSG